MLKILRARTLQRFVLRQFLSAFALTLLACTLFMLLGTFFMTAAEYEDFGVSIGQIAMLAPFLLPKPLAYAIPLAAMIAATVVFGRLSAENEILAAQAGGAPLRVLATPILVCGMVLSLFCLWCNNVGLKWGFAAIKYYITRGDKPEEFFKGLEKEGNSLPLKIDATSMAHINLLPRKTDPVTGKILKPIHIAYFKNQQVGQTFLAEDFSWQPIVKPGGGERILRLTLRNAQKLGDQPSFSKELTTEIKQPSLDSLINIGNTRGQKGWWQNLEDTRRTKDSTRDRRQFLLQRAAVFGANVVAGSAADPVAPAFTAEAWSQTRIHSEALYGSGGALERALAEETEFWRKVSLSFMPFSMAMLGIGLGLLVRNSQRLIGFLLGLLVYALVYYPMMIVSKELATAGVIGFSALWLPNILLFALGYGLWRAHEGGWLGSAPAWLARVTPVLSSGARRAAVAVWTPFAALRDSAVGLFGRKTDGYMIASFVTPLVIVLLSSAALFTALDLVEHGGEVIDGVLRAHDPLPGVVVRGRTEAMLDVGTFYSIRALEIICDLLPLQILLAGMLCVMVVVRNNEHLILKSAGIPLQRAFRPILIVTLIFSAAVTLLRETLMPDLIMQRDYLKPLVYRRNPNPTAVAMYTSDNNGKPVLFEMSHYSASRQTGRDLRIYMVGDAKQGRIPTLVADRVEWDGAGWKLLSEQQVKGAKKPAPKGAPKSEAKAEPRAEPVVRLLDHGFLITPTDDPDAATASTPSDVQFVKYARTAVKSWSGAVTPAFLESERLGSGVMRLGELQAASVVKPELSVEWWRRISEGVMGLFLLWLTIPLILSEEVRGPILGVAFSILFAAVYWGLNVSAAEAARGSMLPGWAPILPHALFCLAGFHRYYFKLQT